MPTYMDLSIALLNLPCLQLITLFHIASKFALELP
jgi:hypothetical protein